VGFNDMETTSVWLEKDLGLVAPAMTSELGLLPVGGGGIHS
jgi:hypothetical protein